MADSRFDNVKYVCWLKVCMALLYAKEGIEALTDTLAGQFYEMLKNNAGDRTCSLCSKEDLKRQWSTGNMTCRSTVCNRWLDAIQSHLSTSSQSIEWNNIDISCLPSEPWECIKPYLPYGCETVTEAKKVDTAAILSLYINNNYFHQYIGGTADKFIKVKDVRNKVMHSTTLELEEQEMEDAMDTIISMLQCHSSLSTDQNCKDAITKIQQLRSAVLEVSLHKEYELRSLNARVEAMEKKVGQTINLYTVLQNEIDKQKTSQTKTLQNNVDNIKSDYRHLHKDVQDMKSEIEYMSRSFSMFIKANGIEGVSMEQLAEKAISIFSLESCVQKMKEDIMGLDKRLANCERRLNEQEQNANQQAQRLEQQEQNANQLAQRLDQQEKNVNQQVQRLDQQEKNANQQSQRLDQQETSVNQQAQRLDQQEKNVNQQAQRLGQQEKNANQQAQRLDLQEKNVKQQAQRLDQQEKNVNQQSQRLNQQEKNVNQQAQRLDQQEKNVNQQAQILDQQEKIINQQAKRLDQQDEKLFEHGKEREPLKSKEALEREKNERRKDLQKQLCGAYSKHCGSMSIYPLRPNLAGPCGYLYVSQEMLEKDPRGPKKPQPDITDKFEPSHEQKDKKVNILNDVFYTDSKLCKNIYITGEAGVGKSTFCDYIVNMWLAAHTGTTVNYTEHSSQDLETMKQFPLLFYVQLKGETLDPDTTDIYANLIEKQWDLDTSVKEFLTEEHCVIIADALDECTSGIPKRGVRNNSTVLTTSRPWKLETLRTDIEGSKIDKLIEIVCLDEQSVETLTEKILPVLAEESGTTVKNSDNFIKEMKEKCLESFLRIPVLLIQILCLWHDNVTIGKSKTSIYCNLVHHQIQVYIKKLSAKDEKKLLTNSETLSPVNCEDSKCQCRAFNEMLLKVGKMALNTLLSDKREYEHVFDHNITEFHEFCEQEIETCLAIGILSQHKLFGKITKLEKFISFVHKSNQEFFGSIYLAYKIPISNIREVLANYICSLDKMLKLEKIIMFVCGLNREKGREMANLLLEAAGRDPSIQKYRQTFNWRINELVLNVQNVILAAVEEYRHNPHELQQKFRLDDIYVDEDNVSRVLSCFPVMEISRPASIMMDGRYNNRVQVDAVMSHVQNTAGLQKVVLSSCTIGSRKTAVKLVPQSLCVLVLSHVKLSHEALTTLSHNLKTTNLRELWLTSLTCGSHGRLRDGKCGVTFDLTQQSHLEMLYIVDCDMSGWSLPTATSQMKDVLLWSVTIPGAMLSGFLRGLPQTGVSVDLWKVTVRPAGDIVSCLEQLRGSREVEEDSVEGWGEGELFVSLFVFK